MGYAAALAAGLLLGAAFLVRRSIQARCADVDAARRQIERYRRRLATLPTDETGRIERAQRRLAAVEAVEAAYRARLKTARGGWRALLGVGVRPRRLE